MNIYKTAWWVLLILGIIKLVGGIANLFLFRVNVTSWDFIPWNIANYSILIVAYASLIGVALLIYFALKKSIAGILVSFVFVMLNPAVYVFLWPYLGDYLIGSDADINAIIHLAGSIFIVWYSVAILRREV